MATDLGLEGLFRLQTSHISKDPCGSNTSKQNTYFSKNRDFSFHLTKVVLDTNRDEFVIFAVITYLPSFKFSRYV